MFINAILDKHTLKDYLSSKNNVCKPILQSVASNERFIFDPKKSIFLLGSASKVDFKINHPTIDAQHAYFVKDICGIKIIPLSENTFVNNVLIAEEKLLNNNDIIKLGDMLYVFGEKEELIKLPVLKKRKNNKINYRNIINIIFIINLLAFLMLFVRYLFI